MLDQSQSGVAVSTIQIGQSLGNSIAPVLGSFLVEPFGYQTMFCGFGGNHLAAGFLFLFCRRIVKKRPLQNKLIPAHCCATQNLTHISQKEQQTQTERKG